MKLRNTAGRVNRSLTGNMGVLILLLLVSAFMFLPMWYTIITAFKPPEEIFLFPPRMYVQNPTGNNFSQLSLVFANSWVPFTRYLFNSLFITVVKTFCGVFVGALAAYPFAKHRFPGKNVIWSIIMVSLLYQGNVTALPSYIIQTELGLINTNWALILPSIATPMYMFLMKQFMGQIPDSLLEAAKIDGAGEFRIFMNIIMPNIKPAWLTVLVLTFQSAWATGSDGLVFNEELKLLPSALAQVGAAGISRQGASAAAALLMLIPPVLAFIVTQSSMMQTMAHSGIKD